LANFLSRHNKIALDTSIFIFQIEENPRYVRWTHQVFSWLAASKAAAVTSTITMLELLVHPCRKGDQERVDAFYALLSTYPHLEWIPTTMDIADSAARLRAQYNLKTPDAIQAATALASKATGLISNDPAFARVPGLHTVILDGLLPA
jgi:predicted nucleic acid-binding protein